ncbi:Mu-like prophage major head subunit gpT family protein [Neisseria sp. Ec49-e6-T10]|uniref:Mu-like prophage major head subunit gpT family protein n=1 Tax=Neisseria sp. Ec49-e6-T10 TaxID=3140744 RepID=UPI003EB6C67E
MIITPSVLLALMTGFKTSFQNGLGMANSRYADIATVITSSTKSNTYGWLGQWPAFREWIGDRVFKDMQAHGYTIENKHFESSVAVNRNDIEDDNLGIYKSLFEEMGRASAAFPDEQVFALLAKGISELCYDGQNFFDTDHPVFPNVDGTGTVSTVSNYYTGTETPWYLLDTSRSLKPLIYQQRKPMTFTAMTDTKDEGVFMRNEYRYGVDGRNNVGFGFWQMAACSKEALTAANFEKVYTTMRSLKADGGRPLGIRPTLLVVPPNLLGAAEDIIKVATINGTTNKNFNRVEILETEWLV